MQSPYLLIFALKLVWAIFIFAYGACLGSLTNVIVYRMPRGLSIVRPPSRCPKCETRLSWRDNIPVFGWIFLKGKCRYCGTRISPEYPIVEAAMGMLFVLFYVVWYMIPAHTHFLGVNWSAMTPVWAKNDAYVTWPEFVMLLLLVGSLFAMTLVDAKTFTIPIWLTWFPALVGLITHPVHAAWLSRAGTFRPQTQLGWSWGILACPSPAQWNWIGLSIGGVLGLGLGLALLKFGLIGRSFADYEEWETKAKAEQAAQEAAASVPVSADSAQPVSEPAAPLSPATPATTEAAVTVPPPIIADAAPGGSPEMWMAYPYARREMIRELAFLAPCVLLMLVGWYAGMHFGQVTTHLSTGLTTSPHPAPLWLAVLSGVLLGYLIGGGVVWAVRIFGSLAFGKEAMGLGDVHLMAGVGACLGWIDSTLAFLGAAFVGLAWAILGRLAGGGFKRMLPYGPFLAVSTVLVLLCKPLIELGLSALLGYTVRLP